MERASMRKLVMIGVALLITGLGTVTAAPQREQDSPPLSHAERSETDMQDGGSQDEPCSSKCLPGGLRRERCYFDAHDSCSRCVVRPDTSCRVAPREDDGEK